MFIYLLLLFFFFFFNDTATTEIYTLSLHDALPICVVRVEAHGAAREHEPLGEAVARVRQRRPALHDQREVAAGCGRPSEGSVGERVERRIAGLSRALLVCQTQERERIRVSRVDGDAVLELPDEPRGVPRREACEQAVERSLVARARGGGACGRREPPDARRAREGAAEQEHDRRGSR